MDYYIVNPWAKLDILRETSIYTSVEKVRALRHVQSFSKVYKENLVIVEPCKPEGPICESQEDETPFCFIYTTVVMKLGLVSFRTLLKKKF